VTPRSLCKDGIPGTKVEAVAATFDVKKVDRGGWGANVGKVANRKESIHQPINASRGLSSSVKSQSRQLEAISSPD